jgi:hypothetical protein
MVKTPMVSGELPRMLGHLIMRPFLGSHACFAKHARMIMTFRHPNEPGAEIILRRETFRAPSPSLGYAFLARL